MDEKWTYEEIHKSLPHGSGIDADWIIDEVKPRNKYVKCYCSYHFMDENGYYDGWFDFTVYIPVKKRDVRDMKVVFKSKSQKVEMIRDYVELSVYWSLKHYLDKH